MYTFRSVFGISLACFRSLLRDKVFLPAIVVSIFISIFSVGISDLTVEDFDQVVSQISLACFHFAGIAVALIWGSRVMSELYNRGIVESQLSTPISRTYWVFGNFLGIAKALFLIWLVFLAFFHYLLIKNNFDGIDSMMFKIFVLQGMLWLVVTALVFFFGSFCRPATMLFCSVCAWLIGTISFWVGQSFSSAGGNQSFTSMILGKIALVWDLSRLNLANLLYTGGDIPNSLFFTNFLYGLLTVLVLLFFCSAIIKNKDING